MLTVSCKKLETLQPTVSEIDSSQGQLGQKISEYIHFLCNMASRHIEHRILKCNTAIWQIAYMHSYMHYCNALFKCVRMSNR